MLQIFLKLLSLLEWGRQHGASISSSVQIRSIYGGRGLFAVDDIPANTELITMPTHLQIGVPQLAEESGDADLQRFARTLPWRELIEKELTFLPCAIALCAVARKGSSSIFHEYLRELPATYSNAVARRLGSGVSAAVAGSG